MTWRLFAPADDAWSLSSLYRGGPLQIKQRGRVFMICNESGQNVAHTPDGVVFLRNEADAVAVMNRLRPAGA